MKSLTLTDADIEGENERRAPLFAITWFFAITLKNYKLFIEVKLIINNVPLTYVYPNTINK